MRLKLTTSRQLWILLGLLLAQGAVPSGPLSGQEEPEPPSLQGWVVDHENGDGLVGALITLASEGEAVAASGRVISGVEGYFGFPEVPPGLYRVTATLLGYTEISDTVRVIPDADVEVTLPMTVAPVALDPIIVIIRRRPVGPLEGFERRRVSARGVFLDLEDIQERNAQEFTDLIRTVPGVRLVPTATGHDLFFRGGCTPDLFLDGANVGSTSNIDYFMAVEDLEAVEVYRGPELPGEFGANRCGAIVAWTKRGMAPGDEGNDRSLKRQLIFAGSLILAIAGFQLIIG